MSGVNIKFGSVESLSWNHFKDRTHSLWLVLFLLLYWGRICKQEIILTFFLLFLSEICVLESCNTGPGFLTRSLYCQGEILCFSSHAPVLLSLKQQTVQSFQLELFYSICINGGLSELKSDWWDCRFKLPWSLQHGEVIAQRAELSRQWSSRLKTFPLKFRNKIRAFAFTTRIQL